MYISDKRYTLKPIKNVAANKLPIPKIMNHFFLFGCGFIMNWPTFINVAEHKVKNTPAKDAIIGIFYSSANTDLSFLAI